MSPSPSVTSGSTGQPVAVAPEAQSKVSSITRITRGGSRTKSSRDDQLDRRPELRLEHRVHDHHEPRVLAEPLLHDRLDRHALQPEDLGHLREHAGPVGHLEVQVEGRLDVGHHRHARRRARGSDGGGIIAEITSPSTALAVWIPPAPGPASVISVIAGDSIVTALKAPLTRRERVVGVEERRVHAHRDAAVDALGRADQLERQPELLRVGDVVGGDAARCPRSCTWSSRTGALNASRARIAILAAASLPVTSSVGSASA